MDEVTFIPEFIVIVTDFEEHPADPTVGILESHIEINEIEIRDGDDNIVNVPGLKDYIMEKYDDELHELASVSNEETKREAAESSADYQLIEDEGYGNLRI